jgi:hypothetical protein
LKIIFITLNSIIFLKISVYMNYIITVNKHNKDYQILVKRTSCLGTSPGLYTYDFFYCLGTSPGLYTDDFFSCLGTIQDSIWVIPLKNSP